MLVRGFGVPDDKRGEHARVVLVLEGVGRRKAEFSRSMTQRFQFTEREYVVLECLARGWTNKEIASALSLAMPTVKEHVRHIMEKTKTNTRTGILMQVFLTKSHSSPDLPTVGLSPSHFGEISTPPLGRCEMGGGA